MKSLIAVLLLSLSVFVNQTCGVDCDKLKERNGWRTLKLGMNPADALRELKRLCAPLEGVANEQLIEQDKEMTRTKIVSVSKQKLGGLTAGTSKIDRLSLTFFDDKLCDISIDIREDGAKDVFSEMSQVFGTPDVGDPDHGTYMAWFWTCGDLKIEWLLYRESPFGGKLLFTQEETHHQWQIYKSTHIKKKVEEGF